MSAFAKILTLLNYQPFPSDITEEERKQQLNVGMNTFKSYVLSVSTRHLIDRVHHQMSSDLRLVWLNHQYSKDNFVNQYSISVTSNFRYIDEAKRMTSIFQYPEHDTLTDCIDLATLKEWVSQPHVKDWYQKTLNEICDIIESGYEEGRFINRSKLVKLMNNALNEVFFNLGFYVSVKDIAQSQQSSIKDNLKLDDDLLSLSYLFNSKNTIDVKARWVYNKDLQMRQLVIDFTGENKPVFARFTYLPQQLDYYYIYQAVAVTLCGLIEKYGKRQLFAFMTVE